MNSTIKSLVAVFALFTILVTGVFAQEKPVGAKAGKPAKVRVEHQPATIEKAQQALKDKGVYKGNVSGKMDMATKDALKTFQKQQSLNPTGHLNKETRVK